MIKWIAIFLALFFTDIVWALYIRWSSRGKATRAGIASIFIYVVSAFTIGEFIKDIWILIPASAGGFCGTYVTIKYLDVQ